MVGTTVRYVQNQSWMSQDVSRSRDTFLSVSVSLCQCLVSDLESLGKWSCLDRDMKKFWIWNSIQIFDTEATMVLTRCIQSKTLCVISHFAKTFGRILFRPFCFVVQVCRIAGFCFLFVSSIYENWSISTTKHMHSMVIYSRPGMSNLLIY